jgi:hypothetical protein
LRQLFLWLARTGSFPDEPAWGFEKVEHAVALYKAACMIEFP